MKLMDHSESFCNPCMGGIEYGHDSYGTTVIPPDGWEIVEENSLLTTDDRPFDVYAGFLDIGFYNEKHTIYAVSSGRWTTWIRRSS